MIDTGSSFSIGGYELGCVSAFIYQGAAKVVWLILLSFVVGSSAVVEIWSFRTTWTFETIDIKNKS